MNLRKQHLVMESIDVFKAFRMTLAYLRCISISFDSTWRSGPFFSSTRKKWKLGETSSNEQLKELTFCYHIATMTMHVALVHDVLCHYRRLVALNSQLRYEGIDKTLDIMIERGIFEEMREIRNGIFHIRANVRVGEKFYSLIERLKQERIDLKALEMTFYDYSEFMFVESDIFQHDREDLRRAFDEAVEYYKRHVEPNMEPDSGGGRNFFEARIIRPDKML